MSGNTTMTEPSADLGAKLDDLRRFVDRRFAELSMEIHASVQLIDFRVSFESIFQRASLRNSRIAEAA